MLLGTLVYPALRPVAVKMPNNDDDDVLSDISVNIGSA